jgi:acylpyruvate hydrolase
MRFAAFRRGGRDGLAAADDNGAFFGRFSGEPGYPGDLADLLARGPDALGEARTALLGGHPVDLDAEPLPPLPVGGRIICVGLNYADHSRETGLTAPTYPALFTRFASTLVGHGESLVRPAVSEQFDFEGELVAIIGTPGRHIAKADALDYVAGYSIFNDATVRDYQFKASQWTAGKNFDRTAAFGPVFVTADELPPGAKGLGITTTLNGTKVQDGNTDQMIFDVPTLVSVVSEILTIEPGDIIVTGTPAGVGMARTPPLWMKPGDVCEVAIEGIGRLRNPVKAEKAPVHA